MTIDEYVVEIPTKLGAVDLLVNRVSGRFRVALELGKHDKRAYNQLGIDIQDDLFVDRNEIASLRRAVVTHTTFFDPEKGTESDFGEYVADLYERISEFRQKEQAFLDTGEDNIEATEQLQNYRKQERGVILKRLLPLLAVSTIASVIHPFALPSALVAASASLVYSLRSVYRVSTRQQHLKSRHEEFEEEYEQLNTAIEDLKSAYEPLYFLINMTEMSLQIQGEEPSPTA
jgi:hypothetical protein